MAKIKKEQKKAASKSKQVKKATAVVPSEAAVNKLVDENNNVVFDAEKEMEKLMETVAPNIDLELPEIVKEGLNELKEINTLDDIVNKSREEAIKYATTKVDKLEEIADKLKEAIENSAKNNNEKRFTSFWGGVSNGWN